MVFVEIVEKASDEVVERMGPMPEHQAEKVARGASINLNRAEFFTRIVAVSRRSARQIKVSDMRDIGSRDVASSEPRFVTPQSDIDWALSVEQSVRDGEMTLYLECMNDVPMSVRVESPRELDGVGRDVRDGCILTGVFCQCRVKTEDKPGITHG